MLQKILLAADGSDASEPAVQQAFQLARFAGSPLVVVTVVDIFGAYYATPESIKFLQEEGHKLLAKLQDQGAGFGVPVETYLLETDVGGRRISELIVAEAERLGADLIVLGSHGWRGVRQWVMGSVASEVCQSAQCSVLIARS
ncbi:MAG: universal stress protein [Candidatus Igneacidithiobacillus chanchocoensis]